MLILIIIMLFLVSSVGTYGAIGMKYSRNRYANILAAARQDQADIEKTKKAKAKIKDLDSAYSVMGSTNITTIARHHGPRCDKVKWNHIGTCTCGAVSANRAEYNKWSDFLEGKIDEPDVLRPAALWPVYKAQDYMRTGTPTDTDAVRRAREIAEATHDADMAEIRARESAALDRELEASKR